MFRITVLGCNGPYPSAGGACSSYLVETDDIKVLMDAGSGSFSNLLKVVDPFELDAIILSHLHWDHMTDIPVMAYYFMLAGKERSVSRRMKLWMPESPEKMSATITDLGAFETNTLTNETELEMGRSHFSFSRMTHSVESYAIKVVNEGRSFVYSGDSTLNGDLVEFSSRCNLLMADSAFLEKQLTESSPHMCAAQCAFVASGAEVEKLALTHLNPFVDKGKYEKEAAVLFKESHAVSLMEILEV